MSHWTNGTSDLYRGDARALPLADASVHTIVTSPPYWGLRDYGIEDAGIGVEPTLEGYVAALREVAGECWRVLRDDGTLWINLGDSYANDGKWGGSTAGKHAAALHGNTGIGRRRLSAGLAAKNLIGQPWRVAFALQEAGWTLRSAIVWDKPNPMPESVNDRPSSAYEMIFLLSKGPRYYYDAVAIRSYSGDGWHSSRFAARSPDRHAGENRVVSPDDQQPGANARNVWRIGTQHRADTNHATFPDELPRRCILAGSSEYGVCAECGAPWERVVERTGSPHDAGTESAYAEGSNAGRLAKARQAARARGGEYAQRIATVGWRPTCEHSAAAVVPATVLDPFVGSGTTVAVAQSLGRRGVGVELSAEYLDIAIARVSAVSLPLPLGGS